MDAAVDWGGVAPDDEGISEANGWCGRCLSFKAEADLARGQARYWRVMHGRAVERERALKVRIEELQAQLHQSERRLFGEKSERSKSKASGKEPVQGTRKRGQQRGAAGHGRRRRGEQLAATMFSIFQTLLLWKLNPRLWLRSYLEACAENGGRPPTDLSAFLPWEMSEARRRQMSALSASRLDSS